MNESIVFFGTPAIAAQTLEALIKAAYPISLVVTAPDKPKGRGLQMAQSPVKEVALAHQLPILQPEKLSDPVFLDRLAQESAAYFVVIAYGKIFKPALLSLPKKACLNIHYSLLPKYRGAAPIQFALINGDKETGVSVIHMDEGMDTGAVLIKRSIPIAPDETVAPVTEKLTRLGIEAVQTVLSDFDTLPPENQPNSDASYTQKITPIMSRIEWARPSEQIYNVYRALKGTQDVFFICRNKRVKVTEMSLEPVKPEGERDHYPAGSIIETQRTYFTVVCGKGSVHIYNVKPESRGECGAGDFINGYRLRQGDTLE